jgi:hypothetical protein
VSGEPLSYRKREGIRLKWWVKVALTLFVIVISVIVVGSIVPLDHRRVAFMCADCGEAEQREEWRFASFRIWSRVQPIHVEFDGTYDRLIALPHTHHWFQYAIVSEHGNLFGYGSIGEGGPNEQCLKTQAALEAIELDFNSLPIEDRRQIYQELLRCPTRDDVQQKTLEYDKKFAAERSKFAN